MEQLELPQSDLAQLNDGELTLNDFDSIIANEPGRAQAVLELTEQRLAQAGSDLETGLRLKSEKVEYERAFEDYELLLGLTARGVMRIHSDGPVSGIDAKKAARDHMIGSKQRIIESDIHRRLETSSFEKFKASIVRNKIRSLVGGVALSGAYTTVGFGLYKGLEMGAGKTITGLGAVAGILAINGIRAGFRKGADQARNMTMDRIKFYDTEVLKGNKDIQAKELHERLAHIHIEGSREQLSALIIDNEVHDEASADALIKKMTYKMEESLDQFYRIENPDPDKPTLVQRVKRSSRKILRLP